MHTSTGTIEVENHETKGSGPHSDTDFSSNRHPNIWVGLETPYSRCHLSHYLLPLGITSVDDLLRRIDTAQALGKDDRLTLGINAPGSHELLVHPNHRCVTLVATPHRRPLAELTKDSAITSMPLIGQNGCGPDSVEEFWQDIQDTLKLSTSLQHPISFGYASLFDLLIFPDHRWMLYSHMLISSHTLVRS